MMKKIIFLLFILMVIFSCKPSNEKLIEGTWKISDVETTDPLNPLMALIPDFDKIHFIFRGNKYELNSSGKTIEEGNYYVTEENLELEKDNVKEYYQIISITEQEMILFQQRDTVKITFIKL